MCLDWLNYTVISSSVEVSLIKNQPLIGSLPLAGRANQKRADKKRFSTEKKGLFLVLGSLGDRGCAHPGLNRMGPPKSKDKYAAKSKNGPAETAVKISYSAVRKIPNLVAEHKNSKFGSSVAERREKLALGQPLELRLPHCASKPVSRITGFIL